MASKDFSESSDPEQPPAPAAKPSKIKQLWQKTGLDVKTLLMMFKGSLPPTIAVAMYQSTAVANQYGTLGYLVAIMSILGMAIMPRGKFLETMSLNLIAVGLGAAINLLAIYSAIQARLHTTAPGSLPTAYNSSASAVCGVWLFVEVYFINYLRAAKPQFQFPAIIYSIFAMVSLTYGPSFPTVAYGLSFMKMLLEGFLTGFALATGVHFLVLPISSRTVVFAELSGYTMSIVGVLKAQTALMHSLETIDPIAVRREQVEAAEKKSKHKHVNSEDYGVWTIPESKGLKAALEQTIALHAKLNGDIISAHREFAWGKLESKDISKVWKSTRVILTPVMGLLSILDLLRRMTIERHWSDPNLSEAELARNETAVEILRATMKALHEPFQFMTDLIGEGFKHVLYTLEISKPPKVKVQDEESKQNVPGSGTFAAYFKEQLDTFENSKTVTLQEWCQDKGIENPDHYFSSIIMDPNNESWKGSGQPAAGLLRKQLFLMLYLEYLLLRIGKTVLDLIIYADSVKQEGKLKRYRLLFPGRRVLYKWFLSVFVKEDMSPDDHLMSDMEVGASEALYLGQDFGRKYDPEHLPPQNAWEKIGEGIRFIPNFFRTDSSAFGFRVAAATMSVAIIGYLQASQQFFLQQRLLWSMIMIAISMSRTAGQSTMNFLLRIGGTTVAMIGAYIIWYIVDGRTAGVIVFLWLWIFCAYYVVFKVPKLIIVGILSIVTAILIIGYELQVQKLGVTASESNGQPAYPTYILAPYRLACVAGGLFVAWIWTIFPYPISEHSELRKDLGASTYMLANMFSNVHATITSRLKGTYGDIGLKGSHAYNLEKARTKIFVKQVALLSQLQMNSAFSKFQLRIGGRFPSETYAGMLDCVRRIFVATSLIAHASETISSRGPDDSEQSQWSQDFRKVVLAVSQNTNRVTSTLSLLSASLLNAQPLPPFMELPKQFEFVERLESVDAGILSIRHIAEPEYSAFVVIQLAAESLHWNLKQLKEHVKNLVGEMDFSFHALHSSENDSDETLNDGIKTVRSSSKND
ncbi:hypothetical protein AMS68_003571 [Peltaster fructicola]|uniref:ER transporter 6TM N-terminal domain-containing protein n=1 Tax=Peltaster fructicola TaxID=286661 RepID=A0A6H0XTJ7_9PEZI|nr:hypothetical protein AMS68_003571 [Peltaster fructicola]